ncbi:hypothetical protein [Dongia sp. agr-C8]
MEQRIEQVSTERAARLYAGMIALSDRVGGTAVLPEECVRALRELGYALTRCSPDGEGRLRQLQLLKVTFPLLEEIARYLASRYRDEAAILLRLASGMLADAFPKDPLPESKL